MFKLKKELQPSTDPKGLSVASYFYPEPIGSASIANF